MSTIPLRRTALLLLLAFVALVNLSCWAGGGRIHLEAEEDLKPRLVALAAEEPLPKGWGLASSGEVDRTSGGAVLKLEYLPQGSVLPVGARQIGARYLAASAGLSENLYSVSPEGATARGLLPLEDIDLPRRALAVEGRWPGTGGYPFVEKLVLSGRSGQGGAPPRAIRAWLERAAARAGPEAETPLVLAAAGDIQVGEYEWPLLAGGEAGLASLLRGSVLGDIRGADLAVANLEAPITLRGYPNPAKRFRFRLPPGSSAAFKRAGFDLFLFANNHGFDFGSEGFDDSLADLGSGAMPFVGAGRDLEAAAAPRFVDAGQGGRLAFVGFAFYPTERMGFSLADAAASAGRPGIAADEEAALDSVRIAAKSGATVIVLAHGGAEYVEEPSPAARALYSRFVDAGAAMVAGSHPHLLQGCVARAGSLIAYSLGNFLFTGETEPPAAWKSALLYVLIYHGKVRGLRIHPIIAGYDFTGPDPDQAGAEGRFTELNAALAGGDW